MHAAIQLGICSAHCGIKASPTGNGLSGLAARAAALSGAASARSIGDGRFRLRVDVPEVAT